MVNVYFRGEKKYTSLLLRQYISTGTTPNRERFVSSATHLQSDVEENGGRRSVGISSHRPPQQKRETKSLNLSPGAATADREFRWRLHFPCASAKNYSLAAEEGKG